MSDSPPLSPLCYIVSGQWVLAGYNKMLIPNPDYNRKGRTELASSNPTPRVQRCRLPTKISGPLETMEFSDDNVEEKEELSIELMVSLKQKITPLDQQVTELVLAVYG
jgi:hypothetical protein